MADKLTIKREAFARAYVETGNASEAAVLSGVDLLFAAPKGGCYVYVLLCQDRKRIIYIGKGTGCRMHDHLREARRGRISGLRKYRAIRNLLEGGHEPIPAVIAQGLTSSAAVRLERLMIASIGRDKIANGSSGVRSAEEIEQASIEYAIDSVIPFDDWRAKRERSADEVAVYWAILNELVMLRDDPAARQREFTMVQMV